jgi:hypothetical protein
VTVSLSKKTLLRGVSQFWNVSVFKHLNEVTAIAFVPYVCELFAERTLRSDHAAPRVSGVKVLFQVSPYFSMLLHETVTNSKIYYGR